MAVLACGGRGESASQGSARTQSLPAASLNVQNRHWLDVVVYVIHGGRRLRMGEVTAAGARRFDLPYRILGPSGQIRLAVDPIGAPEEHVTEIIVVRPGERVDWRLERNLDQSSLSIR